MTFTKTKKPNGKAKSISKNSRFYLGKRICHKFAITSGTKKLKPLKISGSGSALSLLCDSAGA